MGLRDLEERWLFHKVDGKSLFITRGKRIALDFVEQVWRSSFDGRKILTLYAELEEKGVQGENAAGVRAEVAQNAQTIATAFENQLDSLFARDALDISTDLEVLNGMLKGQGLVD